MAFLQALVSDFEIIRHSYFHNARSAAIASSALIAGAYSTCCIPRLIVCARRRGLNGYTLCCGVISEELNGDDYIAVPFKETKDAVNRVMEIGYITKKNFTLNKIGECYIKEVKNYLDGYKV